MNTQVSDLSSVRISYWLTAGSLSIYVLCIFWWDLLKCSPVFASPICYSEQSKNCLIYYCGLLKANCGCLHHCKYYVLRRVWKSHVAATIWPCDQLSVPETRCSHQHALLSPATPFLCAFVFFLCRRSFGDWMWIIPGKIQNAYNFNFSPFLGVND